MKLVIAFVNIVLGLLMGLFAVSALSMYFGGNQKNLDQHLLLKSDGVQQSFVADTAFVKATMKATDEDAYALKYTFVVDTQEFKGIYYTQDTTSVDRASLSGYYLPDDPTVNAVDIDQRLEELEAHMESNDDIKYGGFTAVLSILLFVLGIRSAKQHKKRKG